MWFKVASVQAITFFLRATNFEWEWFRSIFFFFEHGRAMTHAGLEPPSTLKLGLTQASRKLQGTVAFFGKNIFG